MKLQTAEHSGEMRLIPNAMQCNAMRCDNDDDDDDDAQ